MASQSEHDHECEGGVCTRKVPPVVEQKPVESKKVEVAKEEGKVETVVVKDAHVDDSSSVKQVVLSSDSAPTCHTGCGHDHSHPHDH